MSFNDSNKLNKINSKLGKKFINGVLKVSIKIIKARNVITKTIKYEKNLLPVLFFVFVACDLSLLIVLFKSLSSIFSKIFFSNLILCYIVV